MTKNSLSSEYYDNGQVKFEIWHEEDGSKKSSHSYFENGQSYAVISYGIKDIVIFRNYDVIVT